MDTFQSAKEKKKAKKKLKHERGLQKRARKINRTSFQFGQNQKENPSMISKTPRVQINRSHIQRDCITSDIFNTNPFRFLKEFNLFDPETMKDIINLGKLQRPKTSKSKYQIALWMEFCAASLTNCGPLNPPLFAASSTILGSCVTLHLPDNPRHRLYPGSIILFFSSSSSTLKDSSSITPLFHGIVSSIDGIVNNSNDQTKVNMLTVLVECQSARPKPKPFTCFLFLNSHSPYSRSFVAVSKFPDPFLVGGLQSEMVDCPKNGRLSSLLHSKTMLSESQVNPWMEAISTRELFSYILGPPGTGKTFTSAQIIKFLLGNTRLTILSTASSNAAIVQSAQKFYQCTNGGEEFGLILSHKGIELLDKNHPHLKKFLLSRLVTNSVEAVGKYRIIFTTLVQSGNPFFRFSPNVVFIDEACRVHFPETIIPLSNFSLSIQKIFLIGDHFQLGPVIHSKHSSVDCLRKSLPSFFLDHSQFKIRPHQLTTQYRMHPLIAAFPSAHFYNNTLENGIIVKPLAKSPYRHTVNFIDCPGFEMRNDTSYLNPLQAERVVNIALKLRKLKKKIVILSFYAAQRTEIEQQLSSKGLKRISCFTTEQYQGCEAPIIIISTVRCGSLGFVSFPPRINVALTRAKNLLVLVGDFKSLSLDATFAQFFKFYQKEFRFG